MQVNKQIHAPLLLPSAVLPAPAARLAGRALGANTKGESAKKGYTRPVDYREGQDKRKHLLYQQQLHGFAGYGKCDEAQKI